MLQKFFKTDSDLGSLILRVVAGVVMFPHGAQKIYRLVQWVWFHRNYGLFRRVRNSFTDRISHNHRRISRSARTDLRFSYKIIRIRNRNHHDSGSHNSFAIRIFYELVRKSTRRRIRISPSLHCNFCSSFYQRRRKSFRRFSNRRETQIRSKFFGNPRKINLRLSENI